MFDITNLQRITISLLGALALSGTCIAAAIVPARASAATVSAQRTAILVTTRTTGLVGAVRY